MSAFWERIIIMFFEWLFKKLAEGDDKAAAETGKKAGIFAKSFQETFTV